MIGKLIRGRDMRGLLEYLVSPIDQKGDTRPRAIVIGGTFAGTTPHEIDQEFAVLRSLRPKLNVAVVHETLRLPGDAAELSDSQWYNIAAFWATKMGFELWVAVSHGDRHIHIAASRIRLDGSVVSDKHDWTLSERTIREIERRFSLDQIKPSHLLDPDNGWINQKAPSKAQSAVVEKTGLPLPSDIIASVIDGLLISPIPLSEFVLGLQRAGIDVRPNLASTGKMSGFAYALGGVVVTAKAMGRAFTWANLLKRGLDYDAKRDLPELRELLGNSAGDMSKGVYPIERYPELESVAPQGQPVFIAAQAFASASIANFVFAAGTDRVLINPGHDHFTTLGLLDISELRNADVLREVLSGARFDVPVTARILDRRLIALTELSRENIDQLNEIGMQPFSISEIAPNTYEACIRLVPSHQPEPSNEERKMSADYLAKKLNVQSTTSIYLPGFVGTAATDRRRRRHFITLRRAAQVVAEKGIQLLKFVRHQLKKMKSAESRNTPTMLSDASRGTIAKPDHGLSRRGVDRQGLPENAGVSPHSWNVDLEDSRPG